MSQPTISAPSTNQPGGTTASPTQTPSTTQQQSPSSTTQGSPNQQVSRPPAQAKPQLSDQERIANALKKSQSAEETPGTPKRTAAPSTRRAVRPTGFDGPPSNILEGTFDIDGNSPGDLAEVGQEGEGEAQTVEPNKEKTPQGQAPIQKTPKATPKTADIQVDTGVPTGEGQQAGRFDYSAYTPEEAFHLKQMSNNAREFVAKLIRDKKELEAQPKGGMDGYMQHPEAYTLMPEYKELVETQHFSDVEREHWKQQLMAIRRGEAWYGIQGFDERGEVVTSGPFKASDEAEIDVSNALQTLALHGQQIRDKQEALKGNFSQRIKTDGDLIQSERAKRFKWVADPKAGDEKINLPEVGEVSLKQIGSDFVSMFPKYYANHPMTQLAADLFIALQLYSAKIRNLQSIVQEGQRVATDAQQMEPVAETANRNTGEVHGVTEFNTEGVDL